MTDKDIEFLTHPHVHATHSCYHVVIQRSHMPLYPFHACNLTNAPAENVKCEWCWHLRWLPFNQTCSIGGLVRGEETKQGDTNNHFSSLRPLAGRQLNCPISVVKVLYLSRPTILGYLHLIWALPFLLLYISTSLQLIWQLRSANILYYVGFFLKNSCAQCVPDDFGRQRCRRKIDDFWDFFPGQQIQLFQFASIWRHSV